MPESVIVKPQPSDKNMETEIPYMLYLRFKKMADVKTLLNFLESFHFKEIGREQINEEEKIIKFHLKNDHSKKLISYIIVESKINQCEDINIAISMDTPLNIIKEQFSLLESLGSDNFTLIDQEIKNQSFIRDHEKLKTPQQTAIVPSSWTDQTEKLASISVNFEDFYNNSLKLKRRDILLRK